MQYRHVSGNIYTHNIIIELGTHLQIWEELETLLPESDAVSAGWSRDTHITRARRLCGDWSGKLKLLRYQSRGHAMRLRFRSDHARHYAGYRAKLTLTDSKCDLTPV